MDNGMPSSFDRWLTTPPDDRPSDDQKESLVAANDILDEIDDRLAELIKQTSEVSYDLEDDAKKAVKSLNDLREEILLTAEDWNVKL